MIPKFKKEIYEYEWDKRINGVEHGHNNTKNRQSSFGLIANGKKKSRKY